MEITNKISGMTYNLSDEVYVILDNPTMDMKGYCAGDKVRLISGVYESEIPGYHHDKDFWTVCGIGETTPCWVGVRKVNLKLYVKGERVAKKAVKTKPVSKAKKSTTRKAKV